MLVVAATRRMNRHNDAIGAEKQHSIRASGRHERTLPFGVPAPKAVYAKDKVRFDGREDLCVGLTVL